jgi:hypothetical protein
MADISKVIDHVKKWEGGLSRAKTDTASATPSPYYYNGYSDWHTNKGITYAAFKSAADKGLFENNAKNFIEMPNNVWLAVAKILYWDKLRLDDLNSQAIANVLFSWIWASGNGYKNRVQKLLKAKNIIWDKENPNQLYLAINQAARNFGEKNIFDALMVEYKNFYLGMPEKSNPKTEKHPEGIYTKGWLNRLEDLKNESAIFITEIEKHKGGIGLLLLVLTGVYLFMKQNK